MARHAGSRPAEQTGARLDIARQVGRHMAAAFYGEARQPRRQKVVAPGQRVLRSGAETCGDGLSGAGSESRHPTDALQGLRPGIADQPMVSTNN
jgi:hypothetical protein